MKGPYVMLGYYNDKETTNNTIKMDGCIQGIRYIDDDGHLFIMEE